MSSKNTTPRSSSRSKRSTTNLANLRLAPLTAKYTDDSPDNASIDGASDAFTKLTASHHSTPTSPTILSRSSSRRYLGGLSRRSSLYENEREGVRGNEYAFSGGGGIAQDETRPTASHLHIGTAQVPKAKSEAALGVPLHQRQRLSGSGLPVKRNRNPYYSPHRSRSYRTSGATTPRVRYEDEGDDWLAHTARAASGILREQKGTSFLSVQTAINTNALTDNEEEDEGYEELAAMSAMSARTTRSGFTADDELSPISTRTSRWGSRYGSRKGSRRGSMVGFSPELRTPRGNGEVAGEREMLDLPIEPDFVDEDDDSSADEGAPASRFSSLGGIVDKIIGTNFFHASDAGLETGTSESEAEPPAREEAETEAEAQRRIEAENTRRKGEKERLRAAQQRSLSRRAEGEEGAAWEDARWFLGRVRDAWGD